MGIGVLLLQVCKKPGHEAGFKGATYIDCPMKPCFLCKTPGKLNINIPYIVCIGIVILLLNVV